MLRRLPAWRFPCAGLLALVLIGCVGCSPDSGPAAPPAPPRKPILPPSVGQLYIAQEIWLTYESPAHAKLGRRVLRPSAQAKELAEALRRRVLAGEDIGRLAREESNAPGGAADGFVRLPVNRAKPDERDLAVMTIREGEVTELVDWQGGWWFAKRVDTAKGVELERRFEELRTLRARGQAIVLHYDKAHPFTYDQKRTREQAREVAEALLKRALAGEDFAALARKFSSDIKSGDAGGHLTDTDPVTGLPTPWIHVGSTAFPMAMLEVLFHGELGKVHPEVLDTSRGFIIVKPLERKHVERAPPPPPPPAPQPR